MTTNVGGLGLNLTGADVVIFVDHDWNPTKDLQAMDRAHRLGQTRTVNVYRLIMKETLEEKIMHLQRFKTRIANTVIGEDNRSLISMGTDKLFDLLTNSDAAAGDFLATDDKSTSEHKKSGDELPELWDRSQYEEAFDVGKLFSKFS